VKQVWLVSEGAYYGNCGPEFVCCTKREAFRLCRDDGFRWNSHDDIFENDERQVYRSVEAFPVRTANKTLTKVRSQPVKHTGRQ
jgi:hypothetical protein